MQHYPQFASQYYSSPQANFPPHFPYPYLPISQPYPPTSPHAGPAQGQLHYPSAAPSNVLMPGQEIVASQMRLISSLYAELERTRNIVCHNCRERISSENLGQHHQAFASQIPTVPSVVPLNGGSQQNFPLMSPYITTGAPVFASQIPVFSTAASHNGGNQQTVPIILPHITTGAPVSFHSSSQDGHNSISPLANLPNAQLTNSNPASPITTALPHNLVIPAISNVSTPPTSPESSPTRSVNEAEDIAQPLWSVIYNTEIEKTLDVTFVHAFHHTCVCAVRFSPDGRFLAAVLDCDLGRTQIYDTDTRSMKCSLAEYVYPNSEQESYPPRGIWCVCFSPDGRYVVVGSSFERIYVWEIATKRVLAALKGHAGAVRSLDLSPNGRLLVTCSNDCSVRLWKMRDGSSKVLWTEDNVFTSVRFTPSGKHVAASNLDRLLRIWDVRSGLLVGEWDCHQAGIRSFAISPDGKELVSGSWGGIKSWDINSTPPRSGIPADSDEGVEGPASGMLIQKLKFDGHSGEVRTVAISPDGKWMVTGSTDKRVRIWNMQTAVLQCTLEGHASVVWVVDFSPVGNYIAIGSGADFVTVWRYSETE